jgi:malate dehydrogenase (oxaloacetate-decarboxylating)
MNGGKAGSRPPMAQSRIEVTPAVPIEDAQAHTQPVAPDTGLDQALDGADVFIGVSEGGLLKEQDVAGMADQAIVFALANPDPEIDPGVARRHAAVVATGRSDEPNQINNVLAFPGIADGLAPAVARAVRDT